MILEVTCAIALQHNDMGETGQYVAGVMQSTFLKTREVIARLQSSGKLPESIECLKMVVSAGAISAAPIFSSREGVSSGSVALVFTFLLQNQRFVIWIPRSYWLS